MPALLTKRTKTDLVGLNIDEFAWDEIAAQWGDDVRAALEALYYESYSYAFPEADLLRAQRLASQYALDRGADLLTGSVDIIEATRNRVRELVAQAIANGFSQNQLVAGLRDDLIFSKERARMVASTETSTALGKASIVAARDQGQDEKKWLSQRGERVCDDCLENEDAEWIALDDAFPDGSDTIPSHVGCECDITYRTRAVHEEALPAPAVRVSEARCPRCHQLEAKNPGPGTELSCRKCSTRWET